MKKEIDIEKLIWLAERIKNSFILKRNTKRRTRFLETLVEELKILKIE